MPLMSNEEIKGLSAPLTFAASGGFSVASGGDKILSNISVLVRSRFDDRLMRPNMGADLDEFFFVNNLDRNQLMLLESRVREIVATYEPRVILSSVRATQSDSTINVAIEFRIRSNGFQPVYRGHVTVRQ